MIYRGRRRDFKLAASELSDRETSFIKVSERHCQWQVSDRET